MVHECSRYADDRMTTDLSITLASSDQMLAAALMAMALIVIAFGSLALMMIARARFKRNIGKRHKEPKHIPDAWTESGRRMDVPPGDLPPRSPGGDFPDDDDDDDDQDDDDDDGDIEPNPSTPSSPEIAASL